MEYEVIFYNTFLDMLKGAKEKFSDLLFGKTRMGSVHMIIFIMT